MQRYIRRAQEAPEVRYVKTIDGLRALSIFIIAWFHIWQQSWLTPYIRIGSFHLSLDPLVRTGYLFVDAMLLLSGFLLFLPLARGEKLDTGRFFMRRAARILPSYYLSVFLVLFLDAIPNGAYPNAAALWGDLLPHLTFTHVFFPGAYAGTHLNVVLWTLAVEVQFYLLFPLLAWAFKRRAALTYIAMTAVAWGYRAYVIFFVDSNSMYINQLPAFFDVYANGFLAATVYVALAKKRHTLPRRVLCSVGFVLCIPLLWQIIRTQSAIGMQGYELLRVGQMVLRYPLTLLVGVMILFSGNGAPGVQALLGNRVMRFLSAVSYQFYIWHQYMAVKLKKWGIPPALSQEPHVDGEKGWQWPYTFLVFFGVLALSAILTFAFERSVARRIEQEYRKRKKQKRQPEEAAAKEETPE